MALLAFLGGLVAMSIFAFGLLKIIDYVSKKKDEK